ncbi:MAG: cytochrome c biogenesis protein DipZ [Candidatus Saccharimonadaceae bacterium]
MFLLFASFFAGVLTSLAPCILPLLPVIIGSSIVKGSSSKIYRLKPYIIALSLAISVVLFTLLLKVSSLLIGIDPQIWLYVSGGIVVVLGINLLFPTLWVYINLWLGFEKSSNEFLAKASKQSGMWGAIITGAALGPVFSSCSPVYALILATVLPVNLALGLVYMSAYALGLGLALLAIALAGRKLTSKLGWALNPNGTFRRVMGVLLIIVGLMIITGYDKRFQVWAATYLPANVTNLEESLLPTNNQHTTGASASNKTKFNINPYDAPEITGISDWLNTDPLTLSGLKGKVVLIDFWTYSCINCQRTQPYLNSWYDKYEKDGLVIIGVHAPEFSFEKVKSNVAKAIQDEQIKYPVALDNDFATWKAYDNSYWPAKYLIDKDGQVRYTQFGEGQYSETESAIQTLLKESGKTVNTSISKDENTGRADSGQTPETYLGYGRAERFANTGQSIADKTVNYLLVNNPKEDTWSLGGEWQMGQESTKSMANDTKLRLNFSARNVYLVMDGPKGSSIDVSVDGMVSPGGVDVNTKNQVLIDGPRLYQIVGGANFMHNKQVTLTFPPSVTVNAFTFGG